VSALTCVIEPVCDLVGGLGRRSVAAIVVQRRVAGLALDRVRELTQELVEVRDELVNTADDLINSPGPRPTCACRCLGRSRCSHTGSGPPRWSRHQLPNRWCGPS
jgi:hypothetical protein